MPESRSARVLVVDDDERSRRLMLEVLRDGGYSIVEAASGAEALRELRRENSDIDLMVLDIQMPDMDGFAVAREVRRDERLRAIPILAVTAMARAEDAVHAVEAGCDRYLSKPFAVADVRSVVAELLRSPGR